MCWPVKGKHTIEVLLEKTLVRSSCRDVAQEERYWSTRVNVATRELLRKFARCRQRSVLVTVDEAADDDVFAVYTRTRMMMDPRIAEWTRVCRPSKAV